MKNKMVIPCILAVIGFTCSLPTFTSHATEDTGRYIITEAIPNEVSDYAQDIFAHLNGNDVHAIGLTVSPEDLMLSLGFKVHMITTENYSKYYFPVLNGDDIVATLIINDIDNTLSFTMLQDDITKSMNELKVSETSPVNIILTNTAAYAVNDSNTVTLGESGYATDETRQKDMEQLQIAPLANESTSTILIDSDNIYDVSMGTGSNAYAIYGKSCDNLPCVRHNPNIGIGTCWAASAGSIIAYMKEGTSVTISDGEYWRDVILDQSIGGTVLKAKEYINLYGTRKQSLNSKALTWAQVKSQILEKDNPCYMSLVATDTDEGHATVLCGYDYDNTSTKYNRMYIMDPNSTKWHLTTYGSTFTASYPVTYKWTNTLMSK